MNILKATKRTTASTGQVNKLRSEGFIPAILYGGKKGNLNLSLKKLHLQDLVRTETFMSKVFDLDIEGNPEKVLPRDIAYDPVSDEPVSKYRLLNFQKMLCQQLPIVILLLQLL